MALVWTFGFVDIWLRGIPSNDFSAIWAGPRILAAGGDPYDPGTFRSSSEALGVLAPATPVYIYPGWVAVILAPFGALDLRAAAIVWIVLGLLVASAGLLTFLEVQPVRSPVVHALLAFTLVASEPGIVAFYSGQADFLIVGGLAFMAAGLSSGRLGPAGVVGCVMLLKPQLFSLAAPALVGLELARGRRRFVYALVASAAALALLSTLVVPQWWSAWLTYVPAARASDLRAATLPNAMRDVFGAAGAVTAYGLLAASIALAFRFGRSRAALAVWLMVSMSVSPYLWVYDHIVGIVPLAMASAMRAERSERAAILTTLAGASVLTVAATLLHAFPGQEHRTLSFNGFAQFGLTALVVLALWPLRREQAGPGARPGRS